MQKLKLWEFYIVDVDKALSSFATATQKLVATPALSPKQLDESADDIIVPNPSHPLLSFRRSAAGGRHATHLDLDAAIRLFPRRGEESAQEWQQR